MPDIGEFILLQLLPGLVFIILLLYRGYRTVRAKLYGEPRQLGWLGKAIGGTIAFVSLLLLVLSGSVFKGMTSDFNQDWYSYPLGLLLLPSLVILGYAWTLLANQFIYQAYYLLKYPMQYKEYLGISDEEWYSKRQFKRLGLAKSGSTRSSRDRHGR